MIDPSLLNPLAILIAAVLSMMLGALWYSPLLFGQAWLAATGKSEEDLGPSGPAMAGSMVSCLVAAIAMNLLAAAGGTATLPAGIGLGVVVGLGVVAMTMLSDSLFSGWGWRLYFIQMGYRATYLMIMGAIFGAWPS